MATQRKGFLDVLRGYMSWGTPTSGLKASNMTAPGNALGMRVAVLAQALQGRDSMNQVT